MPDYTSKAEQQRDANRRELFDALSGTAKFFEAQKQTEAQRQHDLTVLAEKEAGGNRDLQRNLDRAKELHQEFPKAGVSVGEGNVGISPREANPLALSGIQFRQDQAAEQRLQKYTKEVEPIAKTSSSLENLEAVTNRDGKGGILTNPNAELKSRKGLSRYVGMIPGVGKSLTSLMHPEEVAATQGVLNKVLAEEAGLSQSMGEAERQTIAAAQTPGADSKAVQAGLKVIAAAVQKRSQQAQAILPQDERGAAFGRGAFNPNSLEKFVGKKPQAVAPTVDPAQRERDLKRIAELEAKARGN